MLVVYSTLRNADPRPHVTLPPLRTTRVVVAGALNRRLDCRYVRRNR
jgi:hypothetical protein